MKNVHNLLFQKLDIFIQIIVIHIKKNVGYKLLFFLIQWLKYCLLLLRCSCKKWYSFYVLLSILLLNLDSFCYLFIYSECLRLSPASKIKE